MEDDDATMIAPKPDPIPAQTPPPTPLQTPPQTPPPAAPNQPAKSNRNLIIGVVAAVVLCCCCLVTALGGYSVFKAYSARQQALNQIENQEIPAYTTSPDSIDPTSPEVQIPDAADPDVPQGGLTDEETRYRAWAAIEIMSRVSSCALPTVEGTTIKIVQEPDSSGDWKEEWNVNCGDGSYKAVLINFSPDNGFVAVDVNFQ